ncbi:MAG: hypothetical protein ACLP5H_08995 [Desulfomonilaceae bacterium]
MANASPPKVIEMVNKLLTSVPPPFTVYVKSFSDLALEKEWPRQPWW